jgi:hypothetical protein
MNRKDLEEKLDQLWSEYDYHYLASCDLMEQIQELEDLIDEEGESIEEWEEVDEDED